MARVVRNAVRAVVPVTIALIARVVPWTNSVPLAEQLARERPSCPAATSSTSSTPSTGSSGVVEALNIPHRPSPARRRGR